MKNWITCALLIIVILTAYLYQEDIIFLVNKYITNEGINEMPLSNNYKKDYPYNFVQNINHLTPKNKEDIKNIYYTAINYGIDKISYICEKDYPNCINDTSIISNDDILLSHINNFVHPYNSFQEIKTVVLNNIVTITIKKPYTIDMINGLNNKMNEIINNINNKMNDNEKIKIIHDYIIDNTKYDSNRIKENNDYKSNLAYGPLLQGYGICSGYSDAMSLFLDYFNIPNYRISNDKHVWNLVKLNDKWYHMDLTWDDPITSDGSDILSHTYFLITTDQLEKLDNKEHYFDKNIYSEALIY